jgi:hypothetical protein
MAARNRRPELAVREGVIALHRNGIRSGLHGVVPGR